MRLLAMTWAACAHRGKQATYGFAALSRCPLQFPPSLNLLVKHDEDAEIYINGVLAGTAKGYNADYKSIPMSDVARAALKPGQNTFAVHVHQTIGGQGIDVGIGEVK